MNGKGSRARNNHSEAFRTNFDLIFRSKRPNGLSSTFEASKPLKTQGNGLGIDSSSTHKPKNDLK